MSLSGPKPYLNRGSRRIDLVLQTRPLRDGAVALSRFHDDRWDLTPALFESHVPRTSINWMLAPDSFRLALKDYAWHLINHVPSAERLSHWGPRPAIYTVIQHVRALVKFAHFLVVRGHSGFETVTSADLDATVGALMQDGVSVATARHELAAIKTMWSHRDSVPERAQLPRDIPWAGREPLELIGKSYRSIENRTPRINDLTMNALLAWSMRIVDDFGNDISLASRRYNQYRGELNPTTRQQFPAARPAHRVAPPASTTRDEQTAAAHRILTYMDAAGLRLPGVWSDNRVQIDRHHLARVISWASRPGDLICQILISSGRPIAPFAEMIPLQGVARDPEGQPWLEISYGEAPRLHKVARAAALVVIAYLSGMRTGEVLNLRRGCAARSAGMSVVHGVAFKGVEDPVGEKVPQGRRREVPWTVVEPVLRAIELLENLDNEDLLFPRELDKGQGHWSMTGYRAAEDIQVLMEWVNTYCEERGRPDVIPADEQRINVGRFRRTLAWHIVREPRGLVAGALQYGHVLTQVMQGYAGTLESGFPDDYAFERYLDRLERLSDEADRLSEGEHVSGPAADTYRQRVGAAPAFFEGQLVRTSKEARAVLTNPLVQVHTGAGMHCVFDPDLARCLKSGVANVAEAVPDLGSCQRGCACVARTDNDVIELGRSIPILERVVDDPLAPPIRLARERAELERLRSTVANHEATRG